MPEQNNLSVATFAGGCFWCIAAVFKRLRGVATVISGYVGDDHSASVPTYEQVSRGNTPYVEAVQVHFDASVISYQQLLDVFWAMIDPTALNRQGNDIGRQYRSVIFGDNPEQLQIAELSKERLVQSRRYLTPIVTAIEPLTKFFEAEEYHRDFYERNRSYGYCRLVIDPKIQKLYKDFKELAKE